MVALALEIAIAAAAAYLTSFFAWWLPLIVLPAIAKFGNHQYHPPMRESGYRLFLDTVLMLLMIGWITAAAVICYRGADAWWGVVIGVVVGCLGASAIAPRRWRAEVVLDRNMRGKFPVNNAASPPVSCGTEAHSTTDGRQGMRFSVGVWDWLFGERLQIPLRDGSTRSVTKRWWQEMERQGKVRPVAIPTEGTVTVHLIGRPPEMPDHLDLDDWLDDGAKTYQIETWRIGRDVTAEEVRKHCDPETGALYACYVVEDGQKKWVFVSRAKFKQLQAVEER